MAPNFSHLLAKRGDEVTKPKPAPAGTYHGVIDKYEFKESAQKKTPFVRVFLIPHGASDDVDQEALAGLDLTKKRFQKDYYLTEDALWRLKDLMESCGKDTTSRSLNEVLPELTHAAVLFEVTLRPDQQEEGVYYNDVNKVYGEPQG